MDGYQLQIEELGNLINGLAHATERVSVANEVLKDAPEGQLGHEELDDAGRSLHDRWEHGTTKLAEITDRMVPVLEQTQQAYAEVERSAGELFRLDAAARPELQPQARSDSAISTALDGGPA